MPVTDPRHARNRARVLCGLLYWHSLFREPVWLAWIEISLRMNEESVRRRLRELEAAGLARRDHRSRWEPITEISE
jgi:hypothetical protein